MKKRMLSLFMVLILCLTLLPTALATEDLKLTVKIEPLKISQDITISKNATYKELKNKIEQELNVSVQKDEYEIYCAEAQIFYHPSYAETLNKDYVDETKTLSELNFKTGYTIQLERLPWIGTEENPIEIFGMKIWSEGGDVKGACEPFCQKNTDELDFYWNYSYKTLIICSGTPITISGKADKDAYILVGNSRDTYLTISNLELDKTGKSCMAIQPGTWLRLTVLGNNKFISRDTNTGNNHLSDPTISLNNSGSWLNISSSSTGTLDVTCEASNQPAIGTVDDTSSVWGIGIKGGTIIATNSKGSNAIRTKELCITGGDVTVNGGVNVYGTSGNMYDNPFEIKGGSLTVNSDTQAMNQAPVLTMYDNYKATASVNQNGDNAEIYDASKFSSYKYFKIVPKAEKADTTLTLTPSNTSISGGGTVTLTVDGLPTGETCTVTCDNTSYNPTEENGVWSVKLPNTTADYIFTAAFAGNDDYNRATATCKVSVTKQKGEANLTLTSDNNNLSGGGNVTLTVGGLPTGASCTVSCDTAGITPTGSGSSWSATLPNATATYTFTVTFAGNDSYNSASATCTVSVTQYTAPEPTPDPEPDIPSYIPTPTPNTGNTNKNDKTDKTETVTNPDGSTTTTETKKDGTVIETTKKEDGSTTTVETRKDGTVTETNKTATGTTATTVTDDKGNVTESKVTVSEKDAEQETPVTLPVQDVKPTDKSENAQEISVEIPKDATVTVEIPVEDVTPGTVVIIVDKDGAETVVPTTKMTENGVSVTLTENSTIKIVENSGTFSDVNDGDYFEDAVAYASSRGITDGTSEETFSPNDSCTRAQLVTFLWRAVGQPEAKRESGMSDVANDTYYTEAVAWAFENEIVGGYGNGLFGSEDTITREQMAVILYRFARKTGMDTALEGDGVSSFSDSSSISDYAQEAMNWAVNAGILQGYNNNLMPTAECTRAQVAVMLMRFVNANG